MAATLRSSIHTPVGQRVDQQLLDRADIRDGVGHPAPPLPGHGEDRIADELAGPVVSDVAAAVGLYQLRTDICRGHEDVGRIRPHTERVDVRVLEQ